MCPGVINKVELIYLHVLVHEYSYIYACVAVYMFVCI